MNNPSPLHKANRLLGFLAIGSLLFSTLPAEAALVEYRSTFTVYDTTIPLFGSEISAANVAVGDRYELTVTLNTSALVSDITSTPSSHSSLIYGAVVSASFVALPGNTGNLWSEPVNLTLSSSLISFNENEGIPETFVQLHFHGTGGPGIDFVYTPEAGGEPIASTAFFEGVHYTFSYQPITFGAIGQPLSELLDQLVPTSHTGSTAIYFAGGSGDLHDRATISLNSTALVIPEPGTYALLGSAGATLLFLRRRKR